MVRITDVQTRTEPSSSAPPPAGTPAPSAASALLSSAPTVVAILLLLIASWSDGAFQLRSWAPLAVFALVAVGAGPRSAARGPAVWCVLALAGLAVWALISTAWSPTPGPALEGGARDALYVALVALPILTLPSRRAAVSTAALLTAGAAVIVAATLVACFSDGPSHFLAGRLDDPVGYRNGSAALFALCYWPLVSVAAHRRAHALLRAAAFAIAVAALGLAFLTQSRGVLVGFGAGAVVALALGPDRLRRAWLTILAVGAIALQSGTLLRPYDAFVDTRVVPASAIHDAVGALGTLVAGGFVVALLVALLDGGLRLSRESEGTIRGFAGFGIAALVVMTLTVGLVKVGNPVAFAQDKVDEFKTLEYQSEGQTRLGSTGGQRYDLWRVALDEFSSAPVRGVGEGAYTVRYYADRRTDRNLSTPHSLPFEVLAQLGVVGGLLLAAFLLSAALALLRGFRRASSSEQRWASALAAAGAVGLSQSCVDWLWQIPGLMGMSLVCLATAVAIVSLPVDARAPAGSRRVPQLAGRVAAVLAAVLVGSLFLSDVYVRGARAADISAQTRLDRAKTAHRLDPPALPPRFQEAGALEELGRRAEARRTLRSALDSEPSSFVTMALLGDLETRAGNRRAAQAWYGRAAALNPRDVGLKQLAER